MQGQGRGAIRIHARAHMPVSRPYKRYCCRYHAVYEMYKKAVASFWSVEEVDLSQDTRDWKALSGV